MNAKALGDESTQRRKSAMQIASGKARRSVSGVLASIDAVLDELDGGPVVRSNTKPSTEQLMRASTTTKVLIRKQRDGSDAKLEC